MGYRALTPLLRLGVFLCQTPVRLMCNNANKCLEKSIFVLLQYTLDIS